MELRGKHDGRPTRPAGWARKLLQSRAHRTACRQHRDVRQNVGVRLVMAAYSHRAPAEHILEPSPNASSAEHARRRISSAALEQSGRSVLVLPDCLAAAQVGSCDGYVPQCAAMLPDGLSITDGVHAVAHLVDPLIAHRCQWDRHLTVLARGRGSLQTLRSRAANGLGYGPATQDEPRPLHCASCRHCTAWQDLPALHAAAHCAAAP